MFAERFLHYILTEDLYAVMSVWASKVGMMIPDPDYFAHIHLALRRHVEQGIAHHFPALVDTLSFSYLTSEIRSRAMNFEVSNNVNQFSERPVFVSLDRVHSTFLADMDRFAGYVDISRVVDEDGEDRGHEARNGNESISRQLSVLASKVGDCPVVLIDDGMWSGKTVWSVISELEAKGTRVVGVVVGVRIMSASERRIEVSSCVTYNGGRRVIDWVCERDFFYGVPFSGRSVVGMPKYGFCYASKPDLLEKWASIRETGEFRNFCLNTSIRLWYDIGKLNNRQVHLFQLDRIPIELMGTDESESVVSALESIV